MFPSFKKPTGRGELDLMQFVSEMVEGGFRWTSGSSGVFKERSVSLEDQALLFLASQMQKEHSLEHLLVCFAVLSMVQFLRPQLIKQHKTDLEQHTIAPTSTANRSKLQPFFSIAPFSGIYLLTLVLCQASMFSSYGQVNSKKITSLA